jgi:hypothetical protein
LHTAGQPAYRSALAALDRAVNDLIRHRLSAAHRRIDAGEAARAREYDLIGGLTGLGAYLAHRHHDHPLLRDILRYFVQLTQTHHTSGRPGWWAAGSPDRRRSSRWEQGHAGFGIAHGIAGPLALLSTTMRRGNIVTGQAEAIHTICAWLDHWRTTSNEQLWWPETIGWSELETHSATAAFHGPARPSWCYGTPGLARAQHLAGLALNDPARIRVALRAIIGCLTDYRQLAQLTDIGLCHGWAGLLHTARRAHADTPTSVLGTALQTATRRYTAYRDELSVGHGFLEGIVGVTLADNHHEPDAGGEPRWDACLLVG